MTCLRKFICRSSDGGALFGGPGLYAVVADASLSSALYPGARPPSRPRSVEPRSAQLNSSYVPQAFEHCCELLEHKLNALEHYAQILDKCYRELTILGFISLCVVFSNEFNLWHDHSDLIAFEFAHLLIFGVSMVYVLTTVVACNRLEATSKSWKRIANADTGELIVDLEKVIESGGGDPNGFKPLWKSSMNIFTVDIWEDCCWKALRLMFLREFGLGVEFDYSKYVTTKLYQKLAHSLHVHPATWTLVMLISLLFFGYKSVSDDGTVVGSGSGAVDEEQRAATAMLRIFVPAGLGWVLTVGQIWVVKACTSTVVKMLKQNGCNCANDLPRMLREINSQVEMKNILPQLPMFCDCSDDFIETIHSNLTVNHYKPGETIYAEGDAGPTMIFICTGFADVRTKAAGGTVIGTLSHGDYTGEACLRGDMARTATLVARTHCSIFELQRDALSESASHSASFTYLLRTSCPADFD